MKPNSSWRWLGASALASAFAFAVACSGAPGSSLSPTGPTSIAAAVVSSATSGTTGEEPPPPPPDPCVTTSGTMSPEDPPPCEPPPPPPPPPPPGDQGCTPGYWKANVKKGAGEWVNAGFAPSQTVGTVFAAGSYNSATLLEALEFGGGAGVGGATQILLRAAVAAVLNAASPGVDYTLTVGAIQTAVNAAIASGNRDTILALASALDADNNLGCPLNNSN